MRRCWTALAWWLLPLTALAGEWEPVSGAMTSPGESIPASSLVAAAYAFIWLMVMLFVASIWRRQARLRSELEELRRQIEKR